MTTMRGMGGHRGPDRIAAQGGSNGERAPRCRLKKMLSWSSCLRKKSENWRMNISARCGLFIEPPERSPTYSRSVERRKLGLRLTSARWQNQSQLVSASPDRSCVASKLLRYRWRTCLQLREFDQELDLVFGPNTRFCGLHCSIARSGKSNLNELQERFGRYEGGCCIIPCRAHQSSCSDRRRSGQLGFRRESDRTIECIVIGAYRHQSATRSGWPNYQSLADSGSPKVQGLVAVDRRHITVAREHRRGPLLGDDQTRL